MVSQTNDPNRSSSECFRGAFARRSHCTTDTDAEQLVRRLRQHGYRLLIAASKQLRSREAAELARVRYREGAVDFLRLLDAERALLSAEDALAGGETDLNTSVVLICKALGGGWEAAPQS